MVSRSWRIISNIFKNERGMTGLETAIILIAFVTVAAVFGYAILSAGLFSAERAKETIYAGLNEAKSNVEISGSVTALCDNNTTYAKKVFFNLKNAIAGRPIDMIPCDGTSSAQNKCVISMSTKNDYFSNIKWTGTMMGANNGNNLLETGEQIEIGIDLDDLGTGNTLSSQLATNDTFSLQVKPAIGSTVTIQRTLPPALDSVMDLH
jgi:archaeal flagellin FlaB